MGGALLSGGKSGWLGATHDGAPPAADAVIVEWTSEDEYSAGSADAETWVAETSRNFDLLDPAILVLLCNLVALSKQTADSATYRIRLDGTPGVADGVILAALTTSHVAYVNPPDSAFGAAFARPAGNHLLKLTIEAVTAGVTNSFVKSFGVMIT